MQSMSEGLYHDVFNHVINCGRLLVFRSAGLPVAFMAVNLISFGGLRVYHLEGIITSSAVRGNGFARLILEKDLKKCQADILAFHTQSVLMKKLGEKVSQYDLNLSLGIAALIGTRNLCVTRSGPVDGGRYGGHCLYGDVERFDSVAIKRSEFDYLAGDAIIYAGYINKKE